MSVTEKNCETSIQGGAFCDSVCLTYRLDAAGRFSYVSPSVARILGVTPGELLGQPYQDFFDLEHPLGTFLAGLENIDFSSKSKPRYAEVRRAGREIAVLEIHERELSTSMNSAGGVEGIAFDVTRFINAVKKSNEGEQQSRRLVDEDITQLTRHAEELRRLKDELEERVNQRTLELRQINAQLAESESRYRSVVEDQTEFICRWNEGGVYTFVNEAYCRYMNKSERELLGASFLPNIIDEDRGRVLAEISGLSPQAPTITSEHRVFDADNNLRWHHWTNRALFDEDGLLKGYQSVGRDITDLRLVEDLVREREAHLMRVSRLATMGELISGIAHEIHQPLHAAQLFAEAARRNLEMEGTPNISTAIDCTREITNAISRTATILRQLHSFTASKPIKFELLDMNEVIHEVAAILSYETRKAGVKVHLALEKRSLPINADRVQMLQVLVDWFRNAFEAMSGNEQGDRHLVVSTRRDRRELIVELCDNGSGTDVENTERLFDAFYSTKPGRLGMGLSICKTIAESHNAKVSTHRNPDRGMTFALQIPVAKRTKL